MYGSLGYFEFTGFPVRASVETALGVYINDTLPESLAGLLRAVPVVEHDWSGVSVPTIVRAATVHDRAPTQ